MSVNAGVFCVENNYSYQHIQGVMLLQLNKLASQLKLSHSDYRVMGTLIGLYNKQKGKAFPTIDQLANYCCMGKTTIIKSLNNLVKLNLLVVVKTPGKRNNYFFSNFILSSSGTPHVKPSGGTSCKTAHNMEHTKIETDKEQTLLTKTNDDVSKTQSLAEYREIFKKVESWGVLGVKKLINQYGIQKVKNLINIVEDKKPDNYGAYLRALLCISNENISGNKNNPLKEDCMVKGTQKCLEIQKINEPRLSKLEIITKLEHENKQEEALQLRNLWRMKI